MELESKVYFTTKSIIFYVSKEFGVIYKVGGMTRLLHKLGFSYKKPKGVPGKAKTEDQEAFVEEYNRVKKRVMANRYYPDMETFQRELMLFLRGIRKHKSELSTLITDNFHIVKT